MALMAVLNEGKVDFGSKPRWLAMRTGRRHVAVVGPKIADPAGGAEHRMRSSVRTVSHRGG